ncbi:MAG: TetR/AcrR family transcriptional regulator [Chitinispirillales bacterium]|jgi:AcrR family transcriptional regulator|nr:TetR/AcrR family transcriptional regulator [Chitinispirillales bacterium]
MQNFTDRVQSAVLDGENQGPYSGFDGGAGPEKPEYAVLDPKSARKEAVKDMKRELIMDAAIKVISREGYTNARLEDIAEEAGFSKASLYQYFPDKEALIIHIIIREQRDACTRFTEIVERGLPFLDSIREFAATFEGSFFNNAKAFSPFGRTQPSLTMLSNFVVSMTKHEDLFNETVMWRQRMSNVLMSLVARARADGVLTIPVDDQTVCLYIGSFFQAMMMDTLHTCHADGEKKVDINEATDKLFIFFQPWINEKDRRRG